MDAQGEPENQVQRPHPAGNNALNHMPDMAWCGHPTAALARPLVSYQQCYTAAPTTPRACPQSWEGVCAWGGEGPASKGGVGEGGRPGQRKGVQALGTPKGDSRSCRVLNFSVLHPLDAT